MHRADVGPDREGVRCTTNKQYFSIFLPATWTLREDEFDRASVDGATVVVEHRTWNEW